MRENTGVGVPARQPHSARDLFLNLLIVPVVVALVVGLLFYCVWEWWRRP